MIYKNIYAIGDLQGCYDELQELLLLIKFNRKTDQLWFVGDLVNRGPKSLDVLRFIYSLDHHAITVLGNHDLHLLAVAAGVQPLNSEDTISSILQAPDCDQLLNWLQKCPLMHYDEVLKVSLVHAGIFPAWSLSNAINYTREVENSLQHNTTEFLQHIYGNEPHEWSENLRDWERLRFITNAFTRMRFCSSSKSLNLTHKKKILPADEHLIPWFSVPNRLAKNNNIIFGHWAGLRGNTNDIPHLFALDTGCIWGGTLTAMRLSDKQKFSVPSKQVN